QRPDPHRTTRPAHRISHLADNRPPRYRPYPLLLHRRAPRPLRLRHHPSPRPGAPENPRRLSRLRHFLPHPLGSTASGSLAHLLLSRAHHRIPLRLLPRPHPPHPQNPHHSPRNVRHQSPVPLLHLGRSGRLYFRANPLPYRPSSRSDPLVALSHWHCRPHPRPRSHPRRPATRLHALYSHPRPRPLCLHLRRSRALGKTCFSHHSRNPHPPLRCFTPAPLPPDPPRLPGPRSSPRPGRPARPAS